MCLGWRHAFTSQVRCQIVFSRHLSQQPTSVGRWAHGAGHPRGQATRAPGARRRGCAVQGPRRPGAARGWKAAPSQVRGPSQGAAAPRALPGPVPGAHARPLCASAPQRPDIRTRDPLFEKEAAIKGRRPRSGRDTVAANENEKRMSFWTEPLLPEKPKITEDGPEGGSRLAPSSDDRAGPAEKRRMDTPWWWGERAAERSSRSARAALGNGRCLERGGPRAGSGVIQGHLSSTDTPTPDVGDCDFGVPSNRLRTRTPSRPSVVGSGA